MGTLWGPTRLGQSEGCLRQTPQNGRIHRARIRMRIAARQRRERATSHCTRTFRSDGPEPTKTSLRATMLLRQPTPISKYALPETFVPDVGHARTPAKPDRRALKEHSEKHTGSQPLPASQGDMLRPGTNRRNKGRPPTPSCKRLPPAHIPASNPACKCYETVFVR